MSRLLAIDIGSARTGIAMSDELQLTVRPMATIPTGSLAGELARLCAEEHITTIVVGRPRSLDGGLHGQALAIDTVVERLKPKVAASFVYEDETGTTVAAGKRGTDADAARILLEGYLAEQRRNR